MVRALLCGELQATGLHTTVGTIEARVEWAGNWRGAGGLGWAKPLSSHDLGTGAQGKRCKRGFKGLHRTHFPTLPPPSSLRPETPICHLDPWKNRLKAIGLLRNSTNALPRTILHFQGVHAP